MTATSDIGIRRATQDDVPTLGRLAAMLVAMHHDFDPQRFMDTGPDTAKRYGEWLGGQMKKADVVVLVAAQGDDVIGYVYAGMEGVDYMALRGPAGAVYDILVDPDRRRAGVGRRLLEAAIAELTRRGAPRVVLSTAARNPGAQALFEACGFRRTMIEMTRETGA